MTQIEIETPTTFLYNELDLSIAQDSNQPNSLADVFVDGAPVPAAAWSAIAGTDYFVAKLPLCGAMDSACAGLHSVTSTYPVGAQVSGADLGSAYSYPAGFIPEPFGSAYDLLPSSVGWR